jgi:formate hydrogenlyase subunit 3/multisubunit Na+/H+ antiporter MnhD subunit
MMVFTIYDGSFTGLLLLLVGAVITPLFAGRRRLAGSLNFAFCLAAGIVFAWISLEVLGGDAPSEPFVLQLGGFSIPFLIDGFSAVFLGLIALMSTLTAFYCIGYMEMEHYRHYGLGGFLFNFPVFIAGMVGIVTVDDLSTGFTIAWQGMTLASYFLIRFDHHDQGITRSANKYLLLMELAWVAIVAAAALIPHAGLGTSLHALTEGLGTAEPGLRALIYGLLLFGFGMKVGIFPLGQLWLPDAHSSAPSPISALLSGVMIKTGVYGIVRTLFWMVPLEVQGTEARHLGLILACFGVVTLFIGTVQALKQNDAKRLLAYSSIGQMGYILLGIGTAHWFMLSGNPLLQSLAVLALIGVLYHTTNHALFKGLLFLSTGSVQYATGTKDLDQLGGLLKLMPITALVAAIACVSIAGIPAFSGFASKWAIIASGLLGGKTAGVIVLFGVVALMTSTITLALTVKFYGMTFTAAGIEWSQKGRVREVGVLMLLPMSLIAALCLVQGFFPGFFIEGFTRVFAMSEGSLVQALCADPATAASLTPSWAGVSLTLGGHPIAFVMPLVLLAMLTVAGLFAVWLRRAGGAEPRQAPVWLCGYQTLNGANSYTSSHIYAAFKHFMWWTGGNVRRA